MYNVRIELDIYALAKQKATLDDRSVSKTINRVLREALSSVPQLDPPEFGGLSKEEFVANARRTSFPNLKPTASRTTSDKVQP